MKITDSEIVKQFQEWLEYADADELSRVCGEIFGGECTYQNMEDQYEFIPNENYFGAFDKDN